MDTIATPVARPGNKRGARARDAVLTAAAGLFATRGFVGTSIADVAEAAGLSKPSVLYHFADKDALWVETVESLWADVEVFYRERWPTDMEPSRAAVEIMVGLFIEAALRWPAYVQIPFIEGATPSWRSEWLVEQHFGRHIQTVNVVLERCRKRGLLNEGGAAHLQAVLTGGINMFVAQHAMWSQALGTPTGTAEFLREHLAITLNLTFRSKPLADR